MSKFIKSFTNNPKINQPFKTMPEPTNQQVQNHLIEEIIENKWLLLFGIILVWVIKSI